MTALCVGVDGVRGRWLAVALADGSYAGAAVCASIGDVLARFPGAAAVGVDTPVGADRFPRRADVAARRALTPYAARVFDAFPEAVYRSPDHATAVSLARELTGRGISRQAWQIGWAVLDAAAYRARVVEVHPELSFRAMCGRPLAAKTSWQGLHARLAALAGEGVDLPSGGELGPLPPADVLDAAAAAWSAWRVARGLAETFPADPAPGEPTIHA